MAKVALLLFLLAASLVACHDHHDHDHQHHDHEHDHDHDHSHDGHNHNHGVSDHYQVESHVLILTDQTLQDAIDEFPLILIKFFAPWCGHCKHMAAAYKELATELAHTGQTGYIVAEVDCTVQKEACNKHGIRGYPTLKYFIDGEAHDYSGQRTKEALGAWMVSKQQEVRGPKTQEEL